MEDKTCFLGLEEVKKQLGSSIEDHDLLITLNTKMSLMKDDLRSFMETKANKEITDQKFAQSRSEFLEWKSDIQSLITSITNPIIEEVNKINKIQTKNKDDIESLTLTRARQAGIFIAASTMGGLIVSIGSLLLKIIYK